ncbi:MAG: nuclear transport factor 2 family protein [Mucilaginibacter sp.]|nr:nuclear transport factor 2 family protein [Mucilaginibacter sp.]
MKTLKSIMIGMALLLVSVATNAASTTHHNTTKDEVMDTYLNAVVHGKLEGIDNAIDDDAEFNMIRGNNVNTLHKQQILNTLKAGENIEQDCKCTKSIVQDNDDASTLKVEMKYADFTRIDLITAQRVAGGWKITKVDTSFK